MMDMNRRRELLEEWKNRRPDMGIISITCVPTGDVFLDFSKDINATFNSNRFRLTIKRHPNMEMQALWNEYGIDNFEFETVKLLKYKNVEDVERDDLLELLEDALREIPNARRIK